MTNIEVGDRVKATNVNGDTAEFTVRVVGDNRGDLASQWGLFMQDTGWTFEKITPPMPTEPGLYAGSDPSTPDTHLAIFALEQDGTWTRRSAFSWTDNDTAQDHAEKVHASVGLVRLVRESKS